MGFSCGLVGLPNVGKSTLFNALTHGNAAAQNFPFCTVEPNVGVAPVPDPRLSIIAAIANSSRIMPAAMRFIDIAGLVEGAATGEGLGNQFLAHIRETDCFAHVVRCFEDGEVTHVAGAVDPLSDAETINTELLLADIQTLERAIDKERRAVKAVGAEQRRCLELLELICGRMDGGESARLILPDLEEGDRDVACRLGLITAKPVIYIANISEHCEPEAEAKVHDLAARDGAEVVSICASLEAEIAQLEEEDQAEFLKSMGMAEPGLSVVVRAGFRLLNLHNYFTAGEKEARAWTIPRHSNAVFAAGKIHSDFARGFIRAEVISYENFVACNGAREAREAGKLRIEGRDYIVADGDVIHFRFNV